ncbi:MAG: O-phosphoserine--tRNA ligase [Candidatus Nanohalarchaeota archaeon]|nr:MAG: O-phosphoserine--tRNA ligase [Candidatus Nanohaloarchaeota archaeon]
MQIDVKKTKEDAKKDFEKTWVETSALFNKNKTKFKFSKRQGKEHILGKTINYLRNLLIQMGFDETENLTIIPEEDVYREYGPESAVILDRAFYIAKLPRPEIGLSNQLTAKIKSIANVNIAVLKEILREYKKGNIEGDDFIEELVIKLKIKMQDATAIVDLFTQLKELKPIATNLTFRTHMSGTWYHTLAAMQDKADFPIMLFSVGRRYRNEQKEDSGHLRVHNSASIAIMDPNIDMIAGRRIAKKIFEKIGFKKIKFETKKATSKYYALGLEDEVFVKHNGQWLEIADMGMYSAISLANFGIKYPVFNIGFGVERLAMVLEGHKDIREMIYPQFYLEGELSDKEIAEDIKCVEIPKTAAGKKIADAIIKTAFEHKDDIAPVEIPAWKGTINGKKIEVSLVEVEEGKKLIGPAAFNMIFVKKSNITGTLDKKAGEKTGISFIEAIANNAAGKIEQGLKKEAKFYTGMVRSLANINLKVSAKTKKYIESNNRKIDIKGPVFVTIKAIARG